MFGKDNSFFGNCSQTGMEVDFHYQAYCFDFHLQVGLTFRQYTPWELDQLFKSWNTFIFVDKLAAPNLLWSLPSCSTAASSVYPRPLFNQAGFPGSTSGKEPTCQCRRYKRNLLYTWVRKIPWRRVWQLTPVFLPGESHGWKSLVGYSPWGHTESDMTEATWHACTCFNQSSRKL